MKTSFTVDAILFDMDGTLVDSTNGVIAAWESFAKTYTSIDVPSIVQAAHGVRTADNLRKYCGLEDPETLQLEAARFERAILESFTKSGRTGVVLLPGVQPIIEELYAGRHLPNPCWAICTSATRVYASAALEMLGIPIPDVFVTADDVRKGKPEPDPYLVSAHKCNVEPSRCLVFEDAPAGVTSAQRAGCQTVALVTTHTRGQMQACKADYLVQDLSCVHVRRLSKGVEVTVDEY